MGNYRDKGKGIRSKKHTPQLAFPTSSLSLLSPFVVVLCWVCFVGGGGGGGGGGVCVCVCVVVVVVVVCVCVCVWW